MKKITSAAGLGLRLSFPNVLAMFTTVGILQAATFWHAMKTEAGASFEFLLDEHPGFIGRFGLLSLFFALYLATSDRKGIHTSYTLRRLRLPEGAVTAIWGLMFAGWFVVYLAFQAGLGLLCYHLWADPAVTGGNFLFIAAHRSEWLHFLLPLSEPWAVARNIIMCLACGGFAALSGTSQRHGRSAPLCMFLLGAFWWNLLWPREMASRSSDQTLIVLTLICLFIDMIWTRRCIRDDEN
ncbi:MAG: hypothetical protein IJ960_06230 [Oscillospiraceae bacterium]|nr:hypothetical protein [Oscillospiraceae bacterium]